LSRRSMAGSGRGYVPEPAVRISLDARLDWP
jgi:hypothetical protein